MAMLHEERPDPGSGAPPGNEDAPEGVAAPSSGAAQEKPRQKMDLKYHQASCAESENRAPRRRRSAFAASAPPRLKRAARAVGYACALDDSHAWSGCSRVLEARLTPRERAGLAWASLRSLDAETALQIADLVVGGPSMPLPPWGDPREDAELWAELASREERRAYATACFRKLEPGDRRRFAAWAGRAAQ